MLLCFCYSNPEEEATWDTNFMSIVFCERRSRADDDSGQCKTADDNSRIENNRELDG